LICKGNSDIVHAYVMHGIGIVLVFIWVVVIAGMNPLLYLAMAYLGASLLMLRTYAEHQAHPKGGGRTVIVEAHWFFALLFLNNNLHIVHHRHPAIPWYDLPALYRAGKAEFLKENEGYVYSGYWPIIRQYFFRSKEPVIHPINRRLAKG